MLRGSLATRAYDLVESKTQIEKSAMLGLMNVSISLNLLALYLGPNQQPFDEFTQGPTKTGAEASSIPPSLGGTALRILVNWGARDWSAAG